MPYTPHELCDGADEGACTYILNFLYWSYRRASATISMQEQLYHRIQDDMKQLEGFHYLRHNPERTLEDVGYRLPEKHHMSCQLYEQISQAYAQCCKTVLPDSSPLRPEIRNRLHILRDHVRGEISTVLATKLMETYRILGSVYTTLQHAYTNYGHLLFKDKQLYDTVRGGSIFSALWNYVPSFLVNVMYQFEDKHLELRKQLCHILLQDIYTSDELWTEVETLRTRFYQTMYTHVYHYLNDCGVAQHVYTDMFSYTSSQSDEPVMLPHPYELNTVV